MSSEISKEDFHRVTEGAESVKSLEPSVALGLLSPRLLKREPELLTKLGKTCSWTWFRVRSRTVVFLYGGQARKIVSIGWAQCSPKQFPMIDSVGVTIALVRALRDIKLPREKKS